MDQQSPTPDEFVIPGNQPELATAARRELVALGALNRTVEVPQDDPESINLMALDEDIEALRVAA